MHSATSRCRSCKRLAQGSFTPAIPTCNLGPEKAAQTSVTNSARWRIRPAFPKSVHKFRTDCRFKHGVAVLNNRSTFLYGIQFDEGLRAFNCQGSLSDRLHF